MTLHPRSVKVRDVSLLGIQTAFETGTVKEWTLADLGLTPDQVGEKGSGTKVLSLSKIEKERKCEFLEGSTEEQADELVGRLSKLGLMS